MDIDISTSYFIFCDLLVEKYTWLNFNQNHNFVEIWKWNAPCNAIFHHSALITFRLTISLSRDHQFTSFLIIFQTRSRDIKNRKDSLGYLLRGHIILCFRLTWGLIKMMMIPNLIKQKKIPPTQNPIISLLSRMGWRS